MQAHDPDQPSIVSCTECGTRLAHDQRYCVECGTRRGPLPRHINQLIGGILEQGRRLASPGRPDAEPSLAGSRPWDAWIVAPRAAAAAVLGMLGFGVVVGSLVGGSAASVLEPIIEVMAPTTNPPVVTTAPSGGSTSPSSSGSSASGSSAASSSSGSSSSTGSGSSSSTTGTTTTTASNPLGLPPVKHVFVIVLSGQGYDQTFGNAKLDPYLAKTLVKKGELVPDYYSVAGGSLANEIALVSGQGPTPETVENCSRYAAIRSRGKGAHHQVLGAGCVYPKTTETIANQLAAAKKTWKVYVQLKGKPKAARAELCRPELGSEQASPTAKRPYETWRNPFLYFKSVTAKHSCPSENVSLGQLTQDLKKKSTTPALSYIVADACDDGSDIPCAQNAPYGMTPADAFLKSVVPEIEHSAAYKTSGLIAITFDQAPQSGQFADASSCCNNPTYPNLPGPVVGTGTGTTTTTTGTTTTGTTTTDTTTTATTTATTPTPTGTTTTDTTTSDTTTTGTTTTGTTTTGTTTTTSTTPSLGSGQTNPTGGGGHVGLLLLSPFVNAGSIEATDYYNHFSLLASIEDLFELKHLGYASISQLSYFEVGQLSVFNNYSGG